MKPQRPFIRFIDWRFIFLFAFVFRFLYAIPPLLNTKLAFAVYPDAWEYETIGKNLVDGYGFSMREGPPYIPEMLITPAYPIWIAMNYKVFRSPVVLILWNLIFSALTAVFLFKAVTCAVKDRILAFLAAFLWIVEPNSAVYTTQLIAESLTLMLLIGGIFVGLCGLMSGRRSRWAYAALAGILFGISALAKPVALVPALLFIAFLAFKRVKFGHIAIATVLLMATVGLWVFRNWRTFGLAKLSSVTDMTLSIYHAATVKSALESIPLDSAAVQLYGHEDYEKIANIYPDPIVLDRTGKKAVKFILRHPSTYLKLWAVGEAMLWVTPMSLAEFARFLGKEPPKEPVSYEVIRLVSHLKFLDALKVLYERRFAFMPPLGLAIFVFAGVYSLILLIFALVGLIRWKGDGFKWLILLMIFSLTVPVGICPSPRYRAFAVPFLAILSASGLVEAFRRGYGSQIGEAGR